MILEVNNMSDLEEHYTCIKNNIKYISFLTEQDKYIIMDLDKVRDEELFLSEKFNYPINEFTRKIIRFTTYQ